MMAQPCPRCRREYEEYVEMESVLDPNYPPISGIDMLVCPICECTLRMSLPMSGFYDVEEGGDYK